MTPAAWRLLCDRPAIMKTALLSTLAITMALASARGATWTGGGTDDNWSTPAN